MDSQSVKTRYEGEGKFLDHSGGGRFGMSVSGDAVTKADAQGEEVPADGAVLCAGPGTGNQTSCPCGYGQSPDGPHKRGTCERYQQAGSRKHGFLFEAGEIPRNPLSERGTAGWDPSGLRAAGDVDRGGGTHDQKRARHCRGL